MYCPSCGAEDRQSSQFCRKCGVDLRAIYVALQKPESVLTSGEDEVYRAIAARIRDEKEDLKVIVEEILPTFEAMMASPEERRLTQIRNGILCAAVGAGAVIYLLLKQFVLIEGGFILLAAFVAFFVGIGSIINGWLFSHPRNDWSMNLAENNSTNSLPALSSDRALQEPVLMSGFPSAPASPTENTTRNLAEEPKVNTSPMQ